MTCFGGACRLGVFVLLLRTAMAGLLPRSDVPVLVGCFSSSEPLENQGTYKYQSSGYCSGICTSRDDGVVGLSNGNTCWCGSMLPPEDTRVLDSKCSTPCQGYGVETCTSRIHYVSIEDLMLMLTSQVAAESTISLSGSQGCRPMFKTTTQVRQHLPAP